MSAILIDICGGVLHGAGIIVRLLAINVLARACRHPGFLYHTLGGAAYLARSLMPNNKNKGDKML